MWCISKKCTHWVCFEPYPYNYIAICSLQRDHLDIYVTKWDDSWILELLWVLQHTRVVICQLFCKRWQLNANGLYTGVFIFGWGSGWGSNEHHTSCHGRSYSFISTCRWSGCRREYECCSCNESDNVHQIWNFFIFWCMLPFMANLVALKTMILHSNCSYIIFIATQKIYYYSL